MLAVIQKINRRNQGDAIVTFGCKVAEVTEVFAGITKVFARTERGVMETVAASEGVCSIGASSEVFIIVAAVAAIRGPIAEA